MPLITFGRLIACAVAISASPVRNFTTMTIYTDPKTWNEAYDVCNAAGGHLLDLTDISIFVAVLNMSTQSPWKELPIGDGPPAWIGLHRRVNILGDEYYSSQCEALSDFRIVFWNTAKPHTEADGPLEYCVYDQIFQNVSETSTQLKHDYSRADCSESHRFYCQHESKDPCSFQLISGYYGDTSNDYSSTNDIVIPHASNEECANRCLSESTIFPQSNLNIIEECWGYSMHKADCIIHNVVKANFFDSNPITRVVHPGANLYIKRCFSAAVNISILDVIPNTSQDPNTTCGIIETGNSTMTSSNITIFTDAYTWNEALQLCKARNQELLHIRSVDDNTAVSKVVEKYQDIMTPNIFWLGLHEPDPENKHNIYVWANCETVSETNWDQPPSSNTLDDNLCVSIDVTSDFTWRTRQCSEKHHVICLADNVSTPSYSLPTTGVLGDGETLGPIEANMSTCRLMCSEITYKDMDCWAFAHLESPDKKCHLYFASNSSYYDTHVSSSVEPFSFYRKLKWSETLVSGVLVDPDDSIFPNSCCDVTDLTSKCPVNNVNSAGTDSPTTQKQDLILITVSATWNEAVVECATSGGRLLQVDTLAKYHVISYYISDWIGESLISSDVWVGLAQENLQDPCSLRWIKNCSTPAWVWFADDSFDNIDDKYCVAMGSGGFVKAFCNESKAFVCEIDTGECTMEVSLSDVSCLIGPADEFDTRSWITCNDDCLTAIYNGKECWATNIFLNGTCKLLFYADPLYCDKNYLSDFWGDVTSKVCFRPVVRQSLSTAIGDDSINPHGGCYASFLYPHTRDETICRETTTLSSDLTTSAYSMSLSTGQGTTTTTARTVTITTGVLPTSPPGTDTTKITEKTSLPYFSLSFTKTPSTASTSFTSLSSSASTISPNAASPSTTTEWPIVTSQVTSVVTTTSAAAATFTSPALSQLPPTTAVIYLAKPIYIYPCLCNPGNETKLNLKEWEQWLSATHAVDAKNTSRYRRATTSAWDSRTSSVSIGVVSVSMLITLGVFLLVMDAPIVARSVKYIHGKAEPNGKKRHNSKKRH